MLKYQHVQASVASPTATPETAGAATVTDLTPVITTATVATALKDLKTAPAVKAKVVAPSTSTGVTGKITGKLVILLRTPEVKRKYYILIIIIHSRNGKLILN